MLTCSSMFWHIPAAPGGPAISWACSSLKQGPEKHRFPPQCLLGPGELCQDVQDWSRKVRKGKLGAHHEGPKSLVDKPGLCRGILPWTPTQAGSAPASHLQPSMAWTLDTTLLLPLTLRVQVLSPETWGPPENVTTPTCQPQVIARVVLPDHSFGGTRQLQGSWIETRLSGCLRTCSSS